MASQQGWSQQTPAVRALLAGAMGSRSSSTGTKRKRSRKKKSSATGTRKRSRSRKRTAKRAKPARLVKGSAAAKAYMAKIRRKRKK